MSYNLSNNWIMTYSGTKFDLINPQVGQIVLEDIAHALSQNCRFTSHTKYFYSVAMHSLFGAYQMFLDGLNFRLQLLFMIHDIPETWYNDIAKPLKPLLREYSEFEEKCIKVVYEALGVEPPTEEEQAIIDEYDVRMFQNEIRVLMPNPHEFEVEVLNNISISPMDMTLVKETFLEAITDLLRRYKEDE